MLSALIEGIVLGITLAFLIGPGFVALIQTSLHRGLFAGWQFSVGVVMSDLFLIALSYFGAISFLGKAENQLGVGILGGVVLMVFGIVTFTRRHKINAPIRLEVNQWSNRFFKYVSKGFFMNIFNPFLLIFWMGVTGVATAKYGIPSREILVFYTGTLMAVFTTDILKVLGAHQIKRFLTPRLLSILNRVVGITLFVFGLALMARVVFFL